MPKFTPKYAIGQSIVMRGIVKIADDESGRLTVLLDGYNIPVTIDVEHVDPEGPAPRQGKFTGRDRPD